MIKYSKFSMLISAFIVVLSFIFSSCESKDPSVLKVFVRDENNDLVSKAQVIIIGDTKSNPPTIDFVDTLYTDALGVAVFDMEQFYELSPQKTTSGYFKILVKQLLKQQTGYVRVKEHIVTVETIRFEP